MTAWVKLVDQNQLEHGAAPQGEWKRFVGGDGRGLIFGMGRLSPGEQITHAHDEEEVFYVLSGRGEAEWVENGREERADLVPGTAFFKTTNVPHTLRCTGTAPLLGIYAKV